MKNKTVIITGAASGIGKATAELFAREGANVVISDIQEPEGAKVVKDICATGGKAMFFKADVSKVEEMEALVNFTLKNYGNLDIAINNAGIGGELNPIAEMSVEGWQRVIGINLSSLFYGMKYQIQAMLKNGGGSIVNISSIGGMVAFPGVGFYNATKFAVTGYSESLAKETAPLGIKVTVVAPSGFRTDWAGRSANNTKIIIDDYAATAHTNQNTIRGYSGNQPGDPVRAAKAIIKAVESDTPPVRLLLGAGALKGARNKIAEMQQDIDTWEDTTVWADHPKEEA